MNVLVEGTTPTNAATKTNLDQWSNRIPLPYTAALDSVDPQQTMEMYFNTPRDQFVLIDLKTMKFIDIFDSNPLAAIKEIEGLLPPVDGGTPDM